MTGSFHTLELKHLEELPVEARLYIEKLEAEIQRLAVYQEREMDAFVIGDAVSDGICVTDGKGMVMAINKGYTEITGITEEMILGKSIQTLIDQGLFTRAVSLLAIEQKKKIQSMSTIISNGKKVLITGNPFFDTDGEVIRVLTVMRDLSELLKLKEDLEKVERESEKYRSELMSMKLQQGNRFIGESREIQKIKELIHYVAKSDATVLITGETGCGKEVICREIHETSHRSNGPYIKVNCAAIPESLMESELFGYEKGAFTNANQKGKMGMFELAMGGTILLDEIGEMPLNLQSKLLRVLQEKEVMRIGATKGVALDVRILAATNQDLTKWVAEGKFREDLFYRLNVIPLQIPPLRKRPEDLSLLAHHFLQKFNAKYSKAKILDHMAFMALEDYHWPGNVRELENVMERIIVIDDENVITSAKIQSLLGYRENPDIERQGNKTPGENPLVETSKAVISLKEAVEQLERQLISDALHIHGSTHKAAKSLGMSQPTLFRKAKMLGLIHIQIDSEE